MWQRVQTLYIAVATALIASMFFCDKAEGIAYIRYTPYLLLIAVISALNLLALTTYTHRIFQFRTVSLSAIITVALQLWLAVDYFVSSPELVFRWTAVFPLVAVVLDVLAARNIWADEMIVRSASRLRAAKRKK